jgi:hypothetical protein
VLHVQSLMQVGQKAAKGFEMGDNSFTFCPDAVKVTDCKAAEDFSDMKLLDISLYGVLCRGFQVDGKCCADAHVISHPFIIRKTDRRPEGSLPFASAEECIAYPNAPVSQAMTDALVKAVLSKMRDTDDSTTQYTQAAKQPSGATGTTEGSSISSLSDLRVAPDTECVPIPASAAGVSTVVTIMDQAHLCGVASPTAGVNHPVFADSWDKVMASNPATRPSSKMRKLCRLPTYGEGPTYGEERLSPITMPFNGYANFNQDSAVYSPGLYAIHDDAIARLSVYLYGRLSPSGNGSFDSDEPLHAFRCNTSMPLPPVMEDHMSSSPDTAWFTLDGAAGAGQLELPEDSINYFAVDAPVCPADKPVSGHKRSRSAYEA